MLFDCCVNLADKSFDDDRLEVLQRARAAGVGAMLLTATDLKSAFDVIDHCRRLADNGVELYATCGLHPHHARLWDADYGKELSALATTPLVRAIGETGLDYYRKFSPITQQLKVFNEQVQIAINLQKPLLLHERDAADSFEQVMSEHVGKLPRCLLHCFTGSKSSLRKYLDYDFYIGITGWVCDPARGDRLRELVKFIPPNRLVLETDAPYLLPKTLQTKPKSRRNEPMYLPEVARYCAELLNCDPEQLISESTDNARAFLGL